MASYDVIARFYDNIMGDQKGSAQNIRKLIRKNYPKASSLLELGCGTGSYLSYLSKFYKVCGIDSSLNMLAIARNKLPNTPLYKNNMTSFQFTNTFDAIICLNDTVNHLMKLSHLTNLFSKVHSHSHLNHNGLWVFDINTEYKLDKLSKSTPTVHQFNDSYFITKVYKKKQNIYEWDLRIFEYINNEHYRLHQEILIERSFSVDVIKKMLFKQFKDIKVIDLNKNKISLRSERLHFTAIKK